jgi:exodeoxyribonuclease VII large subunit
LISAVGHETDTTMIDFVADLRAPTPSAAAEMATPVLFELQEGLQYFSQKMFDAKTRILQKKSGEIENLSRFLMDPVKIIAKILERFNNIDEKMQFLLKNQFATKQQKLLSITISTKIIFDKIALENNRLEYASKRLESSFGEFFKITQNKLENLAKLLQAKHYQEILNRGFCLIKDKNNKLISSISQIKIKEEIAVEMASGAFSAYVLNVKKNVVEEENEDEIQAKLI